MKEKAKELYERLKPHKTPILILGVLVMVLLSAVQTVLALRSCQSGQALSS